MKFFLIVSLLFISLNADKIVRRTLGCPTILLLQKAPTAAADDVLGLNMYAIANNCIVINRRDPVAAQGYDPRNSKEIFQQILYHKTGVYLYIKRSAIYVEQDGKKGVVRF